MLPLKDWYRSEMDAWTLAVCNYKLVNVTPLAKGYFRRTGGPSAPPVFRVPSGYNLHVCVDHSGELFMARLRGWVVLISVLSSIVLVIVVLYRFGRPSATYNYSPLHEDYTARETQHTYEPVSLHEDRTDSETQHNQVEAMHRRLVVLTAFSSNHFMEALDMIGSVQKYLPRAKIIVYDLGLNTEERRNVSTFCNVELRLFNFTKYPPHVKTQITNFAWKPLILQELVDQKYDVILYGDTSLRMKAHNIKAALQCLLDFPFLDVKLEYHSTISLTHDGMIKYFQFPPSRQYMAHWKTAQGGCWLLLVSDLTREKLIAPWVDCALHEECIAPEGSSRKHCNFTLNARNDGTYVGCHRYDQSALNIILAKNFGLRILDKVVRREITDQVATVVREVQGIYSVKHHPHCNHTEVLA